MSSTAYIAKRAYTFEITSLNGDSSPRSLEELYLKHRFESVLVPSEYPKTEWVRRRLVPKELSTVLDIPADVARAATPEMQELWIRMLTVPIRVRSEV